ncbi:hypothetical protein [Chryseobacterium shigense]|nr:hypothetical protein [Chryseobacterium shigense]
MRKKIMLWLSMMVVLGFLLHSCVHDDVISSSDPPLIYSKEYTSKSLWKEDETYIKNVMKVYHENEAQIKKVNGIPLWDYAMTMGYTDESFLVVPVANGKDIVACIEVPRYGDQITFVYDNNMDHLKFFQGYTTAPKRKEVQQTREQSSMAGRLKLCSVTVVEMWYPDNENEPNGSGHWEVTGYITKCDEMQGGDGPSNPNPEGPTYPYPGGGGGTQPQNQNPCEKLKTQNANPQFTGKIDDLKSKLTLKKETGYVEKTNGSFDYKDNATATETANSLSLGTPTADMKGYLHTHPNDFEIEYPDGTIEYRKGFKIFSPADVIYFNQMVALANQNGIPLGDIYAVMVSGTGTYQIRFTGNVNQIKTVYTNTKFEYNEMYKTYFSDNKQNSDELNFLKFMDEHMYVKGVSLVKMNDSGTFTTKTLNSDKSGLAESDCPQ